MVAYCCAGRQAEIAARGCRSATRRPAAAVAMAAWNGRPAASALRSRARRHSARRTALPTPACVPVLTGDQRQAAVIVEEVQAELGAIVEVRREVA